MKGKGKLPFWLIVLLLTSTIFFGKDFLTYLGIKMNSHTINYICFFSVIISVILFILGFHSKHVIEEFFEKVGIEEATKIRKVNTFNGYDLYLTLPMGKSSSDFNKHKEALEQYLDSQVDISYTNKSIKVSVTNKNPLY